MVHEAGLARSRVRVGLALLVREDGDQPPVAGIEVEMALRRVVEIRLLEDERHAEHALPEVDRGLPVRAVDRDVVDALGLELPHALRRPDCALYSLRCRRPARHELDVRVWTTSTARSLSRIASASSSSAATPRASSTVTGSGGSCFTPAARGLTRMWPLTRGANAPTTSRIAVGKTFTPRTISMSSVRPTQRTPRAGATARARRHPHLDVIARPEAQRAERRGAGDA